jgi:hypothetical protein
MPSPCLRVAVGAVLAYLAGMRTTLPLRAKKMIGMFLIIVLVIVYSLCAVAIATATIAESPWYIHMAYFGLTGFLWIIPAAAIISWMSKETR